jgi:O-acetylhomoserine/O-acetylserine sulfhydrylase-like pyridoxal-dependent enzyme
MNPTTDVFEKRIAALEGGAAAVYAGLQSSHGHDGFLADTASLVRVINKYLDGEPARAK